MKKTVSLFALFFITLTALSQPGDSIRYGKLGFGISFSPDYSYRTLKTGAADSWMKDVYDTLETAKYSYTAGFNITYHIHKNLVLGSGLLFADKGEKTKKYEAIESNNFNNHYYYLDVPVKASYYLLHKKINLFLSAGLSANIYLNSHTTSKANNSDQKKQFVTSRDISRLNLAATAGFGIDCPLTDRWYFKLEPCYRRSLSPIANTPIKKYLYSFGLSFGFFCHL